MENKTEKEKQNICAIVIANDDSDIMSYINVQIVIVSEQPFPHPRCFRRGSLFFAIEQHAELVKGYFEEDNQDTQIPKPKLYESTKKTINILMEDIRAKFPPSRYELVFNDYTRDYNGIFG